MGTNNATALDYGMVRFVLGRSQCSNHCCAWIGSRGQNRVWLRIIFLMSHDGKAKAVRQHRQQHRGRPVRRRSGQPHGGRSSSASRFLLDRSCTPGRRGGFKNTRLAYGDRRHSQRVGYGLPLKGTFDVPEGNAESGYTVAFRKGGAPPVGVCEDIPRLRPRNFP